MTRREHQAAVERVQRRQALIRAAHAQYQALPPDRKIVVDLGYELAEAEARDIARSRSPRRQTV